MIAASVPVGKKASAEESFVEDFYTVIVAAFRQAFDVFGAWNLL